MRKGKIYCPVNGRDCPYYKNGECVLEIPIQGCVECVRKSDTRLC